MLMRLVKMSFIDAHEPNKQEMLSEERLAEAGKSTYYRMVEF